MGFGWVSERIGGFFRAWTECPPRCFFNVPGQHSLPFNRCPRLEPLDRRVVDRDGCCSTGVGCAAGCARPPADLEQLQPDGPGQAERARPGILRQAREAMHGVLFAPAQQAPAAKARVAPEDDFHLRPRLPQPRDQQLQNRPRVAGGATITGSQTRHEQLFTTKNAERQETVVAVVTRQVRAFLPAMPPISRGGEVEEQPGGRRAERSDALIHPNPMQRPGGGALGAVFQPAARGTRRQRLARFDRRLPSRSVTERVGIVEVFKLCPSERWLAYSFHPNRHWGAAAVTTFLHEVCRLTTTNRRLAKSFTLTAARRVVPRTHR